MLPDRVSNPGPLTYESGALPIALRGPARFYKKKSIFKQCMPCSPCFALTLQTELSISVTLQTELSISVTLQTELSISVTLQTKLSISVTLQTELSISVTLQTELSISETLHRAY